MRRYLSKWYILLLLPTVILKGVEPSNNPTLDENRHPRVSGRIVKLYSGIKRETFTCNGEGFQADPVECTIFYRCIKATNGKYTVLRFQCGPGTVYDPDTEICNHPHSTKRSECRSSRPFQFITTPVDQINDNDIELSVQELPSPITTRKPLFNEQTLSYSTSLYYSSIAPVVPQNSEYGASAALNQIQTTINPEISTINTKITDLTTSKSSVVSTPYQWSTSSDQYKSTITSFPIIKHGNKCTHDGFVGDNEDCRKFYRCVNNQNGGFIKYEFMCSESTIWDDDIQSCNHPWSVRRRRCSRGDYSNDKISKTEETYSQKNEADVFSYGVQMTQSPVQVTFTSSTPRQMYYENQNNINKESSTWDSKNFANNDIINNAHKIQTEYPVVENKTEYLDSLNNKQTQSYESITKSTTHMLLEVKPDTIHNTNYSVEKSRYTECTQSGFMGDLTDCRKFYRCVENGKGSYTRHDFLCGEGTAWDKNIESCNHAWMVKECEEKIMSNITTSKKHGTENISITGGSTNMNNELYNVGSYNLEKDKEPELISQHTTFSLEKPETLSKPSKSNESQSNCISTGYMGSEEDCRKFYRCIENGNGGFNKFEYQCGEGTVWDQSIEACNHGWAVKHCGVYSKNEMKTTASSAEPTIITTVSFVQTTDSNVGYISSNRETTPKLLTTNKDLLNIENKCQRNGFMADSYDCRKFYRCVDNGNQDFTRYEHFCGEGTVWDSNINACNHISAVENCRNNVSGILNESIPLQSPTSENAENIYSSPTTQTHKDFIRTTESTTVLNIVDNTTDSNNNKLNSCSNSGFIGDEIDCKKFYRCVSNGDGSYKQYEFYCGEGTLWDSKIEACNHAWAVKKCGGSSDKAHQVSTSSTAIHSLNDGFANDHSTQNYNQTFTPIQHTSISTSTNNILTSNNAEECKTVGFLADKNDCKIFYRCVENEHGGFIRYEFSCGEGTVWDRNINACIHASSVKECEIINKNILSSNGTQSMTTVNFAVNYTESEPPTTVKTSQAINICITEGFFGDQNDCKRFYRCITNQQGGFFKYEFTCGEGTIWDQNIQSCIHESSNDTNCIKLSTTSVNKPPPAIDNSGIGVGHTTINFDDNSTEKHDNVMPNMESTCEAEGFYPNLQDCRKFFRCVNNGEGGYLRYNFTCGEKTIWVQSIQACDHENDNSTCNIELPNINEPQILTTTLRTSTEVSTVHINIPNKDVGSTETPNESISQSNECSSEGYFANSKDCRQFYRCVLNDRGTYYKYDYFCGEGTAWDADKQSCNHITTVINCHNIDTQESQSTTMSQYEQEIQTTERIRTTKVPTTIPESTSTKEDPLNVDNCDRDGYFGKKYDCQKFYRCVGNGKGDFVKYDYICGIGTIWDQDILVCNHPQDVKNPSCDQEGKNSSSTTNHITAAPSIQTTITTTSSNQAPPVSSIPTQTMSSSSENISQGSSNCSSEESSKKPTNQNITCTKAGYFPNPNDCKKFYRCVDWDNDGQRFSVFHFECGEGTIWDPSLDTCNYENSIYPPRNCSSLQSQNGSNTSETTTMATAENFTSGGSSETTTQTSQTTEMSTSAESTTQQQTTSSKTTTTQSTSTEGQTTTQQLSTNDQTSSTNVTPSDTTSTTTEQTTSGQTATDKTTTEETATPQQHSTSYQTSSTTVIFTDTSTTTTEQATSEHFATDKTTPTSEIPPTTTDETTTIEKTDQTTSENTTTTTELTTSTSEQPTSSFVEQSSTEQSSTHATESSTAEPTTKEETTTQGSTTEQQSSTESTTKNQTTTSITPTSTSTSAGITTENTQETTTEGSSSATKCPDTESDQYLYACPTSFRRHPKYCNLFYQCLENNESHELKIAVFNCPSGTIYDESKIQCVEENKADKKCQGNIAKKRRLNELNINDKETITVSRNKYECPGIGHYPFDKNEKCSPALLKCETSRTGKLRGFVFRCPENYIYWSVSRRCEPISMITECKQLSNQWTGRAEIPIERKNIAHIH